MRPLLGRSISLDRTFQKSFKNNNRITTETHWQKENFLWGIASCTCREWYTGGQRCNPPGSFVSGSAGSWSCSRLPGHARWGQRIQWPRVKMIDRTYLFGPTAHLHYYKSIQYIQFKNECIYKLALDQMGQQGISKSVAQIGILKHGPRP